MGATTRKAVLPNPRVRERIEREWARDDRAWCPRAQGDRENVS